MVSPQRPFDSAKQGRKTIFLDIDGVLNKTKANTHITFEPLLLKNLKRIVDETGADIVLSTFWRKFDRYIAYVLNRHGIDGRRVVGRTPGFGHDKSFESSAFDSIHYENRAAEIQAYLDEHPNISNFVILDDRPTAATTAQLKGNFIETDSSTGLTSRECEFAIKILNGGDPESLNGGDRAL